MNLKNIIKSTISEYLNEVRYVDTEYPNVDKETPLKDSEKIRVYHGFYSFNDVEEILKNGLSGKEKAKRIYSYEYGNNPYGLFVTVDFNVAKDNFAGSGVIIEFTTKISDLEAPVWVGGRNYFVQGEYTESFKDLDDREQQRLINRQKAGESPYDYISKSDRPELAKTIFENSEKQALFVGDLNPNMIKYVWYNEKLHKEHLHGGKWKRYERKDFINKLNIDTKRSRYKVFLPNDDFDLDLLVKKMYKGNYENPNFKTAMRILIGDIDSDHDLKSFGFYPKQIKQIRNLYKNGEFDKYITN